jgi:mannose-6-phosphate isomerase-like protein (cupin superfamily)
LNPEREDRPWGSFTKYVENVQATVKVLKILEGEATFLQRHKRRDELWFFLSGEALVVLDGQQRVVTSGEVVYVARRTVHRVEGLSEVALVEVALGDYDEGDVERLSDRYGRSSP